MKRLAEQATTKFKQLPMWQRIAAAAAVGVILIAALVVVRGQDEDYAVLYGNLSEGAASEVMEALDSSGIPYRLEANGTRVTVPRSRLAQTRIALASEGVSGRSVPEGWEILDSGGLATSDFRQQVDYQRALEGELASTLMTMEPVEGATVHLSLPERSVFAGRDEGAKSTASVLLELRRTLRDDEISTITYLVSSAVENLDPTEVTVASSDGTILHVPGQGGTGASTGGRSDQAIEATRSFEAALAADLTTLARQMTGRDDARVVVRADLNFDATTIESEDIDPDQRVPGAEHTESETWTGTQPGDEGIVGVDGGPLPDGAGGNGTYEREETTAEYVGDRVVTRTEVAPGTVQRLSVAAVLPTTDPGAVDLADVERVLAAAAGIDPARGDDVQVTVLDIPEDGELPEPDGTEDAGDGNLQLIVIVAALVALLALIVTTILLLAGRKRRRDAALTTQHSDGDTGDGDTGDGDTGGDEDGTAVTDVPDDDVDDVPVVAAPEAPKKRRLRRKRRKDEEIDLSIDLEAPDADAPAIKVADQREEMDRLKTELTQMAASDPGTVANLLSTWIAGSGDPS